MRRTFGSIAVLFAILCVAAADARAHQSEDREAVRRGPDFLVASAASGAPVRVEPGQVPVLGRTVTLRMVDVPLEAALRAIEAEAGIRLVYSSGVVPLERRVSLNVSGVSVAEALTQVLRGANVDVVLSGSHAALVRRAPVEAPASREPGTIFGQVWDRATALPVLNAQISVDSVVRGYTDAEGRYQITDIEPGPHTVRVALIGYAADSREVEVPGGGRVEHNVWLAVAPEPLAELVVTATGDRRRVELGSDITVINADSIVATEPIASVTDLLEGRVPGLVVQRTSGAPGDPARIRLRGASSPNLSNDPIVIVDGVRVYSRQSDERGANLANAGRSGVVPAYAAPSPLDYIDPHTIETIQVIKGPSAATLYGQDAANGVIVITTKQGRPGPARWSVSTEYGQSRIAGDYPELYLRWGHPYAEDTRVFCPITHASDGLSSMGSCEPDSLATSQILNDPELTVLDAGRNTGVSVGVSGGGSSLTYNVTGSYRDEVGLVALPDHEIERYRAEHETAPPEWMQRPQNLTQWSASARVRALLGQNANVSLTSNLSRTVQQRSSLERQLGTLMSTFFDEATGTYYRELGIGIQAVTSEVLTDYYERATATATQFTNGVNLNWRPRSWLSVTADAGLNVVQRADEVFLPGGVSPTAPTGVLQLGQGTSIVSTVNLRARTQVPLGLGFRFQLATGVNYTGRSVSDFATEVWGLPEGTESLNGAADIRRLSDSRLSQATFGWYIEPGISHRRFWLSTGLRLDGGSTFGTRLDLPSFPKLSLSYLISDEPYFPSALQSVFNTLRLRVAYGHAGRQPGPTDRLRLYGARTSTWVRGQVRDAVFLETLGNTELKPERTREFEGGFDADLFDDRLSVSFTGYRKTTEDALLDVPVAPSVYGSHVSQLTNIGVIRNTGLELGLGIEPVRSDLVSWRAQLQVSRNRNIVVELGPGVEPFFTNESSGVRVVPGFPLFGRWGAAVLGYADANGNGVLEQREVVYGDTLVYLGTTLPEYTASLHSTVSLFRGALSVSAALLYEDGMTQLNDVAAGLRPFSRGYNDPSASLAEQLPHVDLSGYTLVQTVNTLRLNSASVRYSVPARVARWLGADALSLSLQGTNLGLWTNYRGMDPSVNATATGTSVIDTGVLPAPRTWQIRVNASY